MEGFIHSLPKSQVSRRPIARALRSYERASVRKSPLTMPRIEWTRWAKVGRVRDLEGGGRGKGEGG